MRFKTTLYALAASALLAPMAVPAGAAPLAPTQPAAPARGESPVVLAQSADFDVYIDGQGREIIVDSRTGHVVEVNPPGQRRFGGEPMRQQQRARDLDRRSYDLSDPRDRQRLRRDREAVQGMREPPPEYGRSDTLPPPDDGYGVDDGFGADDGFGNGGFGNGGYDGRDRDRARGDAYPSIEQRGNERRFGSGTLPEGSPLDDSIRREPLGEPLPGDGRLPSRDNELASVPPDGGEAGARLDEATPRLEPPGLSAPGTAIVPPSGSGASADVAAFQVLLDRTGASPGVIDGRIGDNVNMAIDVYKTLTGTTLRTYDKDWVKEQLEATGGPAFMEYTITNEDAAGPYVASLPSDYAEKAKLDRLGYTSVPEMLAERFHMDEGFLKTINPEANFNRPGTIVRVIDPGKPLKGEVARIEADKAREQVRAYDAGGDLVAAYPATIGSSDTPSPSGTHTVERVAFNPNYTYNPKVNFKQGENDDILTIPPGPNGPVGSVWIALSKPTYGIHGTPEPSTIGKTASHGCVRLTNWDAQELAKMVKEGVEVTFVE